MKGSRLQFLSNLADFLHEDLNCVAFDQFVIKMGKNIPPPSPIYLHSYKGEGEVEGRGIGEGDIAVGNTFMQKFVKIA